MRLSNFPLFAFASASYAHFLFARDPPLDPMCSVYTVVESPIVIATCFKSNTVLLVEGCTSLEVINAPTCVTTTLTASSTIGSSSAPVTGGGGGSASASGTGSASMTRSGTIQTSTPPPTGTGTATTSPIVSPNPPPGTTSSSSTTTPAPPPGTTSSSTSAPTSTPTGPPHISLDGICGAGVDATCQDSTYGNCCSGTGFCGHAAVFCGTGCQSAFGYCTNISNDGSCGFGVTCLGSTFGNCCSQYLYCGNDEANCGKGCQSEFGSCTPT